MANLSFDFMNRGTVNAGVVGTQTSFNTSGTASYRRPITQGQIKFYMDLCVQKGVP
jgi:hypothetical protein